MDMKPAQAIQTSERFTRRIYKRVRRAQMIDSITPHERPTSGMAGAVAMLLAAALGTLAPAMANAQVATSAAPAPASTGAAAPPQEGEGAALAKKVNNPISDLVSVPFQMNWENGINPQHQTRFILNIQPVVPFSLTEDWNMIARVITPIVSQPPLFAGGTPTSGVGDVLASFFFSPTKGDITWGVGPAISVPSTAQPTLGTEKWSAGPTVVVLKQQSGWTYGALGFQVWSFAGNANRPDVSQMFLQPFLLYTTKSLWTIGVQSESTANWKASAGDTWNVPVNVILSKLSSFGVFPASYQFGGGYFVAKPQNGATWKIRAGLTILLPKKK